MDQQFKKHQINDWYHAYSNDVYKYAFFMLGDHDQAKDILQDTFLQAYKHCHSFQGGKVKNWLFRIARNLTIDYMRIKRPIAFLFNTTPSMKAVERTPEQMAMLMKQNRNYILR